MVDQRIKQLAYNLINYSCRLQSGEKILIESIGLEESLVKELVKEVYNVGGIPFVTIKDKSIDRSILMGATKEQLVMMASYESARMKDMDAYIGLRSGVNVTELSDVPSDKMSLHSTYLSEPVHGKIRVPNTKWVVLRYPTPSMAQLANMSTEAFEDFYFNVCNLDYSKMSKAMDNLVSIMNKTDKVRITGKNTNLSFSINEIDAVKCAGEMNIPDGEVFTAPVKTSVNGYITYNTPAVYQGFTFDNIRLEFKDGKIIDATANNTERINGVFDTDDGARFIGEFAIGVNPYILNPMKDTLF
ncbi:MAG: aminopeptidase, partial [Clostridium sp.]